MQIWIGIGNLTRDPEMKYTGSGTAVTRFSIAINYKAGDNKDAVDFFNVTAWAKLAEVVAEYCRKGGKVCVTGEMHQREWENQEGQKIRSYEVTARNVEFLGTPGQHRDEAPIDERMAPRQQQRPAQQQLPQPDDDFLNLPF